MVICIAFVAIGCANDSRRRAWPLPLPATWLVPARPLAHTPLSEVLAFVGQLPPGQPLDRRHRDILNEYLAVLAQIDPRWHPELFVGHEQLLAHYVNAHLAWSVALSLTPELANTEVNELTNVEFPFGGGHATLNQLRARIEELAVAEPRVGLLLNPGWRGGPEYPIAALEGHSLAFQLAEYAARCGRTADLWHLDADRRELRASAFLASLVGLSGPPTARARRALDLVSPDPALRASILSTCSNSLQRCSLALVPIDIERRWRPLAK
jgi:hypothetical protein